MDETALNYNPEANKDDGSCKVYCPCDTEEYYYVVNKGNCEGNPCIKDYERNR